MKSYGRAPTFLMATGFEQVRSVVAFLAGDVDAARDVQLELPETGVCTSDPDTSAVPAAGGSCCGAPEPAAVQESAGGCGTSSCGTPEPAERGSATGITGGLLTGSCRWPTPRPDLPAAAEPPAGSGPAGPRGQAASAVP